MLPECPAETNLRDHFQLVSMPNPTNVLTRHAFMMNGWMLKGPNWHRPLEPKF